MAKGAQVRELLQALQLKEQELRGPGVEGTGKELMPVDEAGVDTMFERLEEMRDQYDMESVEWDEINEQIGTLTETFGTMDNPTPFTQAMESLKLPNVSRRNFLKGLAATATPNPLSILGDLGEAAADLPVAPLAKQAAAAVTSSGPVRTIGIEIMKPVWDITEGIEAHHVEKALDAGAPAGKVHDTLDYDDIAEEAFEEAADWMHHHPYAHDDLQTLDMIRDEISGYLYDAGVPMNQADDMAKQVAEASWPEFREFDAANPWHAGASFDTDITGPKEIIDIIEKANAGESVFDMFPGEYDARMKTNPNFDPMGTMRPESPYIHSDPDLPVKEGINPYEDRSLTGPHDAVPAMPHIDTWYDQLPRGPDGNLVPELEGHVAKDLWRYLHGKPLPDLNALGGLVRKYAKGGTVKTIVDATERDLEMLQQYHRGSTVQPGVFSTLDELIKDAPQDMTGDQWIAYLTPGRVLKREGMQFPLKKEELEFAGEFGLEEYTAGRDTITRDELRVLVNKNRMPFEATMARENFDADGELISPDSARSDRLQGRWSRLAEKYDIVEDLMGEGSDLSTYRELTGTEYNIGPLSGLQLDRAKWGANYSAEGRLYTQTPGSSYEESVTRIPTTNTKQGHFSRDTMAWSRTSSHDYKDPTIEGPLQTVRVRLVDEIQSDVHRQAAKFHWQNEAGDYLNPWQFEEMKASGKSLMEFNPAEWKKIRQGYFDHDAEVRFEGLEEQLEEVDNQLHAKRQVAQGRDFDEDPEVIALQDAKNKLTDDISIMSDKVTNMPYKSPGDYAALELRKQLANAVENDESYLALVRGSDQLERYSGMGEAEAASSEHFYDNVYRKELQKLANRYGAPMEDIKLDVGETTDLRTPNMIDWQMESPGEMAQNVIEQMAEGSGSDGAMAVNALQEDVGYLYNRMAHDDYEKTFKLDAERDKLTAIHTELDEMMTLLSKEGGSPDPGMSNPSGSALAEAAGDEAMNGFTDRGTIPGFEVTTKEQNVHPHLDAYMKIENRLTEIGEEFDTVYNEYAFTMQTGEEVIKTFPALKITDEVRDRVLKVGVPQYQEGGLVREKEIQQRPGGLSVFSMLSSGDMTEDEIQEVMDDLKEAGYDRETQELMGTWDYWKDVAKRVPATMSSMWKTLDEDTGLAEWKFPIPMQKPYIGMGEEDVRSMMDYNEMAREHNVGVRPGIIDDTIGVAALPYAGYNWAFRDEEGDEPVEIPEGIMEAMGRSQELMETIEQDWELGEARGLPQHTATGLGVMLGQVPSPKSAAEALFGSAARVAKPLTSRLPGAVRTAGSAAMFPVKAGAEFFDPTVNPSFKNYLIGSGFGAALGTTAEAVSDDTPRSYEEVKADRELRVLQEKQYFDTISNYTEENWDGLPLQTQLSMLSNDDPEVNEAVWEALDQEQQQELLRAADAAGMFEELDDAE